MLPNMKQAIEATESHFVTLNENIAILEDFDLTPFDERDQDEIKKHLNYLTSLCQTYLNFLKEGFDPDVDLES